MPLYTYTCPECEIEIEELRPAARADDPVECPVCHGLCTRDISSFSFRSRSSPTPVYASPQQVARALHGPGCPCCTPRRRS